MAVTFQCRDDSALQGAPMRARPCRCERPVVDEDGLCICGRWPAETVDHTWSQQAWRNAKAQRPTSSPPFAEDKHGRLYRPWFIRGKAAA